MEAARSVILGAAQTLMNHRTNLWGDWKRIKREREERSKGDSEEAKQLRWGLVSEMIAVEKKVRNSAAWTCEKMVEYLRRARIEELHRWERCRFIDELRRQKEALSEWDSLADASRGHEEDWQLVQEQNESNRLSPPLSIVSMFILN